MVSEMTSISNVYGLVVGMDTFSDDTIKYTTSIAMQVVFAFETLINLSWLLTFHVCISLSCSSLAVFTWFYTSLAGLPASIVTDKFQAYLMASLVFILLIVACVNPENRLTKKEFAVASNWTTDGLVAAVTLMIAIACGESNENVIVLRCIGSASEG
jgi:Na+/proline symporter